MCLGEGEEAEWTLRGKSLAMKESLGLKSLRQEKNEETHNVFAAKVKKVIKERP